MNQNDEPFEVLNSLQERVLRWSGGVFGSFASAALMVSGVHIAWREYIEAIVLIILAVGFWLLRDALRDRRLIASGKTLEALRRARFHGFQCGITHGKDHHILEELERKSQNDNAGLDKKGGAA